MTVEVEMLSQTSHSRSSESAVILESDCASPQRVYTRSNTGCWTCRARRKKCDEEPGACLTCQSLGLECAGYGAKPLWMDGGELEKEMAQNIKAGLHKRRKRGRQKAANTMKSSEITSIAARLAAPVSEAHTTTPGHVLEAHQDPVGDKWAKHERTESQATGSVQSYQCMPGETNDLGRNMSPAQSPSDGLQASKWADDLVWPECDLAWDPLTTQLGAHTTGSCLEGVDFDMDDSIFAVGAPLGGIEQAVDRGDLRSIESCHDQQISCYVDRAFPNLSPINAARVLGLFRDRLAHLGSSNNPMLRSATLAHAVYAQNVGLKRLGLISVDEIETSVEHWRSEALSQIRDSLTHRNDEIAKQCLNDATVDVGLSLLSLLFLQIRRGVPDHDNLLNLVGSLYGRCRGPAAAGDQFSSFVCSSIMAVEILASASLRRRPFPAAGPMSSAAEDLAVLDIAEVTGSETWVFACISGTTMLRMWKQDMAASQTLSVAELVRRAMKLEQDLGANLRDMEARAAQSSAVPADVLYTTRVYAAAARAYLHVVLSGANPAVDDIASAVDEAVAALRLLANASLIRRLSWPICVTASLAKPCHDVFFASLEAGGRGDYDECTSVLRALELARETQRLRRIAQGKEAMFDWMDAMDSLGSEWILL